MSNITIILTTTVNVTQHTAFQCNKEERINTYVKAIFSWLNNTSFNIVVVENSGYPFLELGNLLETFRNKLEVISFIPEYPPSLAFLSQSKGGMELFSIHYAFEKSRAARHSLYIIKVTGRFFVPDLEGFLSQHNLHNFIALKQNYDYRCEIVGSHNLHFNNIFNITLLKSEFSDSDPHIENVYKYRFSQTSSLLQCPVFNIEPTPRGGLNEIYYTL